mmetsp:Transcript_36910/g.80794  ORF Transcript_36910/g.80794 Transcript_36910/m.80794 type:complete len:296 (+) Transcript_36910:2108-2995(+)
MQFRRIVSQCLLHVVRWLPRWLAARSTSLCGNDETNLAAGVGGDCSVGIADVGVNLRYRIHKRFDDINVKPHTFALRANDAAFSQTLVHSFVKGGLKKNSSRTNGIRRVSNNDIKGGLVRIHKFSAVHDMNLHARIIISLGKRREILLGYFDDIGIELADHNLFHSRVLRHFAKDAAVSAANNKYLLGIRMRVQRDVGNHFLVGEFIAFSDLNDTIEYKHSTMILALEDQHVLILGPMMIKDLINLKGHGLSWPQLTTFMKPAINNEIHAVEALWLFVCAHCSCSVILVVVCLRC